MVPQDSEDRIRLSTDRIKYWLGVGAQPTDRVARFLGNAKLIKMPEIRETPQKSAPKAKAQERVKAEEEALKAKAEAAAAPAPAPEPEVAAEVEVAVETASAEPEPTPEAEAPAEEAPAAPDEEASS